MYTYTTPTITCVLEGVEWSQVLFVRIAVESKKYELVRIVPVADIDTEEDWRVAELKFRQVAYIRACQGFS